MKKIYLLIFIVSLCAGYGLFHGYKIITKPPVVHVFIEAYATNPALTQMIEFIRLPKSDEKIIAWHRFANRKNVFDLSAYNATEIDLLPQEAMGYTAASRVLEEVMHRYKNNPKTKFVLHGNFVHASASVYPFLKALPPENIERIHLYEDGYGYLFKNKPIIPTIYIENAADTLIEKINKAPENAISFPLHRLYPVTYHFMHAEQLYQQPELKELANWLKPATIQTVNFDDLNKTLNDSQKKQLYRLVGFDYQLYQKRLRNRPSVVFTMGYYLGDSERERAEKNWLKTLRHSDVNIPKNAVWLYKPHPSLSQSSVSNYMKKHFPDMIEIPAQIPFEILIVAGLKPIKTAGFGSSLFYSLKPADVLFYAARRGDTYLPFLQRMGIVRQNQIVNLDDYKTTD